MTDLGAGEKGEGMTGPTAEVNIRAKNRQVAEWLGMCWHESVPALGHPYHTHRCTCGDRDMIGGMKMHCEEYNPNFIADPLSLLRLMREREDWDMFVWYCYWKDSHGNISVPVDLILDTTGKLLEAVWKWLKQDENDA